MKHFTHTPLYKKHTKRVPKHVQLVALCIAIFVPYSTLSNSSIKTEPYEQEFVITAYYSPLPGQCCYVRGGLEAEKILNGQGIKAADETPVYPGMIAAPASYPFGTKVSLPGLGTFAVHDRGGAINELSTGAHRLDIWVGYGEEGLARALGFGVQRIKGTVYPNGTAQPNVQVALDELPVPVRELKTFYVQQDNFLAMEPKEGQRGFSVYLLQDHLQQIGYLKHRPTGFFGPETRKAFAGFLKDFHVNAPENAVSDIAAAYVLGARARLDARKPFKQYIDESASHISVAEAQRLLRFVGYYKGRTHGVYDENLKASILKFQIENGIVASEEDKGAGRIGPSTRVALRAAWNRKVVARHADHHMTIHAINDELERRGVRFASFLEEGYRGSQVRILQKLLADQGFFPSKKINGNYGPLTAESVLKYQLEHGLVSSAEDNGAATVGPATLRSLQRFQRGKLYRVVRADGWHAL